MKILFAEEEWYYKDLGLTNIKGIDFIFGGMKLYNRDEAYLKQFGLFVCAYYPMPHSAILTVKFKKMGIKTVLVSDGIFDFANSFINEMNSKYGVIQYHPILQDYFVCVGEKEVEYFSSVVKAMDYMPKRMISKESLIPLPSNNRVLITTANTPYFNEKEYIALYELISGVVRLFIEKQVEFSVRLFDGKLLNSLEFEFGDVIKNDVVEGFEDTLARYTSVITTPSSVAVVSMYHQRATAMFLYRNFPNIMQSGWLVPSPAALSLSLSEFIEHDEERMRVQNRILESYASSHSLPDRLSEILGSDSALKNDQELFVNKAYENILRSKFNINIEWCVRRIYRKVNKNMLFKSIISFLKKKIT